MGKKHVWFDSIWDFKIVNKKGKVVFHDIGKNSLADEGEESILEVFFRENSAYTPSGFYVRLCNDTLIETDTLSSILNEPSGNGYSAQTLERSSVGFPTKEMDDGDYRLVTKEITFTADGGDIGPVTTAYLATSSDNTGKLIAYRALPVTRTISDGDSAILTIRIKLSPGN